MTDVNDKSNPFVEGGVAFITGAASGIGKAIAIRCGKARMRVILVDVARPNDTCNEVTACGGLAIFEICDVSNTVEMEALASRVITLYGPPTFLVNNAGISRDGGTAVGGKTNVYKRTFEVNFLGVVNGVQSFLPSMIASGKQCVIVNVGSKQGITKPPGNVAYNASKAALNAYTEGLQHELREMEGCTIRAHLLVPGWTNSDIALNSKRATDSTVDPMTVFFHESKPAAGAWMPSQVVEYLEAEILNGKFYIICPDNEVDEHTDKLRMTWTMADIVEKRPPLSRWHKDFKVPFAEYLAANPKP